MSFIKTKVIIIIGKIKTGNMIIIKIITPNTFMAATQKGSKLKGN